MLTTVLNSHAAANKAAWLLVPADEIHLLSTSFWIGGLLMLDMQMGTQETPLQPVSGTPGRYSGATGDLSMPGHWRITLLVRRTGYDDASATFPYFLESSPSSQTGGPGFPRAHIPNQPGT